MPIYSFTCETHGDFDKIVPYDTPSTTCPRCPQCETTKPCPRSEKPTAPGWRNPGYGIG